MQQATTAARDAIQPVIRGPASGRMLTPFTLSTPDGRAVRPRDFRQRANLVLMLHHGSGCAACRAVLDDLVAHTNEVRSESGKMLVIGPPGDDADQLAENIGSAGIVLTDDEDSVAAWEGLSTPAVIVTDRFGEIWAAWEGGDAHRLPDAEQIVEWLEFIEIQCPECHPPEPWE